MNGVQLFGVGHTVTFNGVISESGGSKYFEINGGNTAVFNAANTYSGNTDVYNGSTLQFAANGYGIVNGGFYTFGGQMFEAEYTSTDFELVAVPEPATWLAGGLMVLFAPVVWRRRRRAQSLCKIYCEITITKIDFNGEGE